jgi:hypothetical protein
MAAGCREIETLVLATSLCVCARARESRDLDLLPSLCLYLLSFPLFTEVLVTQF